MCIGNILSSCIFIGIYRSVDLEQRDRSKRTPLLAAAAANNFKVTEKLLSVGANVTVTDEWDQNIIHLTATYGAVDVLKVSRQQMYYFE